MTWAPSSKTLAKASWHWREKLSVTSFLFFWIWKCHSVLIKLPRRKHPCFPFLTQLKRSWLERESFDRFLKGFHSHFRTVISEWSGWQVKSGLTERIIIASLKTRRRVITLRSVTARATKRDAPINCQFLSANSQRLAIGWWFQKKTRGF